ncbi:hypothetical protein B5K06_04220 [Rhizobium grahamii]|uniref:Uncharacterized protein n=1 Tax=Rhizobium grahamii TaxID=1120045 RepID=A0A370KVI7_9HYPH|nr:hypothetical protein B5K06_04220 [Rhizobium grahamii]
MLGHLRNGVWMSALLTEPLPISRENTQLLIYFREGFFPSSPSRSRGRQRIESRPSADERAPNAARIYRRFYANGNLLFA